MEVMANFTERLRQLRDESGKTQSQIAKELGLTPQAFSYFVNGREPNYETLGKIADYFQVSVDYLLGRSDVKTADPNLEAACKYTGLSEKAVNILSEEKDRSQNFINALLCSEDYLLLSSSYYLYSLAVDSFEESAKEAEAWDATPQSPSFQRKKQILHQFQEEFGGETRILYGRDYLDFYRDQVAAALKMLLPGMVGESPQDENTLKRERKIIEHWYRMMDVDTPIKEE